MSKGHVTFLGDWEFFHVADGTLCRAPRANPLDLDGWRQGARFECCPRADDHASHLSVNYGVTL